MNSTIKLTTAVGLAVILASCNREQADSSTADAAQEPSAPPPALEAPPSPGMASEGSEDALDTMAAMPQTPEKYRRPVNTTVQGVAFSTSGNDTDDTIGPPAGTFSPQDSVYVELTLQGTDGDYLVTTRWIDPEGEALLENGRTVENAGTEKKIFSLSKPDGWQPGNYRVQVDINGTRAGEYPFVVR